MVGKSYHYTIKQLRNGNWVALFKQGTETIWRTDEYATAQSAMNCIAELLLHAATAKIDHEENQPSRKVA